MAEPQPDHPQATVLSSPGDLAFTLKRNIALLRDRRAREAAHAPLSEKIAQRITDFTGSMGFVLLHLVLFGGWIGVNAGWIAGVPRFDRSLVILAMAASVEAIFLSTFVLISQNRNARNEAKRAELDLQINLLAEHEVTRLISLTGRIARHLGLPPEDEELKELERDVAADAVLDTIADHESAADR